MNGYTDHNGYRQVRCPDHPLARKNGRVLEHRKVVFDAMGHGPHPCHWCDWPSLPWQHKVQKRQISVDHLDGNKLNNSPDNLVVSCWWCNTHRSWQAIAPRTFDLLIEHYRSVPPWHRPVPIRWLAASAESAFQSGTGAGTGLSTGVGQESGTNIGNAQ